MRIINSDTFFAFLIEEISAGKTVTIRAKGTSMLPFIHENDILQLVPLCKTELKKMDIILFKYKDSYLLHRIVKKNNEILLLQGDAVAKHTEKIKIENAVALLQQIKRKNGKIIKCKSLKWRLLSYLWYILLPFRSLLLKVYKKIILYESK
ncbi:MAG TPA: S24/S26 family peptidase [Bacteroidales bacterium]|nr:S24/S26 family peptidase [Bacteroidales bacterium]